MEETAIDREVEPLEVAPVARSPVPDPARIDALVDLRDAKYAMVRTDWLDRLILSDLDLEAAEAALAREQNAQRIREARERRYDLVTEEEVESLIAEDAPYETAITLMAPAHDTRRITRIREIAHKPLAEGRIEQSLVNHLSMCGFSVDQAREAIRARIEEGYWESPARGCRWGERGDVS